MELIHGECLQVMNELIENGRKVDMVLTDPPFQITNSKWDVAIPFDQMWECINGLVKPDGAVCLFGAEPFSSHLRLSNIRNYKYDWTWIKPSVTGFLNAKKQPLRNNENISVFYRKQCLYNPQMRTGFTPYRAVRGTESELYRKSKPHHVTVSDGDRYPINTLYYPKDNSKLHPSQKPVALLEYLINTYTNNGDVVLDFTAGSFSTAIACINTNRKFIGIEMSEKYYAIGRERVERRMNEYIT